LKDLKQIEEILNDLKSPGIGIESVAVISRDCLVIMAKMLLNQKATDLAAMSGTMVGAAETLTAQLCKGIPERVIVETKSSRVIAVGAGSKALLVVVAANKSNEELCLVLLTERMNTAARKIKKILE